MSEDKLSGLRDLEKQELEDGMTRPHAPELDAAEYLPEMAEFDLTEAQKIELLQTLWSIMRSFVELGFQADICGQIFGESNPLNLPQADNVQSFRSTQNTETPLAANGKESPA
jgi:hypothetical protein